MDSNAHQASITTATQIQIAITSLDRKLRHDPQNRRMNDNHLQPQALKSHILGHATAHDRPHKPASCSHLKGWTPFGASSSSPIPQPGPTQGTIGMKGSGVLCSASRRKAKPNCRHPAVKIRMLFHAALYEGSYLCTSGCFQSGGQHVHRKAGVSQFGARSTFVGRL